MAAAIDVSPTKPAATICGEARRASFGSMARATCGLSTNDHVVLVPVPASTMSVLVDTHDAGFRKRFARIAAQREAELREALARAGVDALELSTDADLVDAVVRFTDMRKRRTRLAAGGGMPAHLKHAA